MKFLDVDPSSKPWVLVTLLLITHHLTVDKSFLSPKSYSLTWPGLVLEQRTAKIPFNADTLQNSLFQRLCMEACARTHTLKGRLVLDFYLKQWARCLGYLLRWGSLPWGISCIYWGVLDLRCLKGDATKAIWIQIWGLEVDFGFEIENCMSACKDEI